MADHRVRVNSPNFTTPDVCVIDVVWIDSNTPNAAAHSILVEVQAAMPSTLRGHLTTHSGDAILNVPAWVGWTMRILGAACVNTRYIRAGVVVYEPEWGLGIWGLAAARRLYDMAPIFPTLQATYALGGWRALEALLVSAGHPFPLVPAPVEVG